MRDDHNRWEKYKGILAQRASDHPVQWVLLTVIFAFLAGLNTICVLFGSHFLRPFQIPVALGVYVVAADEERTRWYSRPIARRGQGYEN